ncbi:MAG: hypothetical protein ACYDCQ_23100, partial [Dehalococcoidia bacterium]
MMEEDVRTYHVAQEATADGITVSVPWIQRQANGAVIARLHISSPRYTAGELLLTEQDLTALDPEERPLRTQVRRFWGYTLLKDVTAAHLQTARFDVGFRADIAATRGLCGLSISIIRTFRPGEGPRAAGGPWVVRFPIADEAEIAAALEAEAARQEAAQREAAQREAAREAAQREATQREAARLERIRQENARLEATRLERLAALRPPEPVAQPAPVVAPEPVASIESDYPTITQPSDRGRRPPRFGRQGRQSTARTLDAEPQSAQDPAETAPEIAASAILGPARVAEAAVEARQDVGVRDETREPAKSPVANVE